MIEHNLGYQVRQNAACVRSYPSYDLTFILHTSMPLDPYPYDYSVKPMLQFRNVFGSFSECSTEQYMTGKKSM